MATLIVGIIIAALIFLAVKTLYNDRKKGKSSCGCKCSGCANSAFCHGDKK